MLKSGTTKIDKKIVKVEVVKDKPAEIVQLQPLLQRPDRLDGSTYKINKSAHSDHAFYVTINDITVNRKQLPFEIFINSKNMENFAWIVALTRVLSAIFRHGGDPSFLVSELRSVIDPRGGYFRPGGKYMPSLVAEIGDCINKHLVKIGLIKVAEITQELVAKRKEVEQKGVTGRTQCPKCSQFSVARMDGCETCLECSWSKCG